MRKMMTTLIISLFCLTCIAPIAPQPLHIPVSEPVYVYNAKDPLLRAVIRYESNYKELAVNRISGARGILQITKVMIREVNKICTKTELPNRYTWNDAFDPIKSIEIWWIVQNYKNPDYYYDKAVRIWFGTGRQYDGKTWHTYYNDVLKIIN